MWKRGVKNNSVYSFPEAMLRITLTTVDKVSTVYLQFVYSYQICSKTPLFTTLHSLIVDKVRVTLHTLLFLALNIYPAVAIDLAKSTTRSREIPLPLLVTVL